MTTNDTLADHLMDIMARLADATDEQAAAILAELRAAARAHGEWRRGSSEFGQIAAR